MTHSELFNDIPSGYELVQGKKNFNQITSFTGIGERIRIGNDNINFCSITPNSAGRLLVSKGISPTITGGADLGSDFAWRTVNSSIILASQYTTGLIGTKLNINLGNNTGQTVAEFKANNGNFLIQELGTIIGDQSVLFGIYQGTSSGFNINTTSGSGAVIGSGTGINFINMFKVGDTITANGETRTISAITSATNMTTDPWNTTNTTATFSKVGGFRFGVQANGKTGINTNIPTSLLDITSPNLSGSQTVWSGLSLNNTTATNSGSSIQISPYLRWSAKGYANATSGSQDVSFRSYVVPISGSTTPTGYLTFESSISGSAYSSSLLTLSDTGRVTVNGLNIVGNGVVSVPAVSISGSWFTGGTSTTTKPLVLIEPAGTTSTGWNTAGTGIGVNAATGFTGNLLDLQLIGVSKFKVASDGTTTISAGVTATSINGNIFTTGSTYSGSTSQTYTFPTTTATIARTDSGQSFSGIQNLTGNVAINSNSLIYRTTNAGGNVSAVLSVDQGGSAVTAGSPGVMFDASGLIYLTHANGARRIASAYIGANNYNNTAGSEASDFVIGTGTAGAAPVTRMIVTAAGNVSVGPTAPTSLLHTSGSFATGYVAKTANYTATISDFTIECTANTFTVTLPTAVGIAGRIYYIVNSGAGTITIGTTSSQTFVNVTATPTTLTMSAVGTVVVQSNGVNWMRISSI